MVYMKLTTLIKQLKFRTDKGKMRWGEAVESDTYQVSFSDFTLKINKREDPFSDAPDYIVTITDDQGKVIEEFTDEELDSLDSTGEGAQYYRLMREIYETARRYALGTEDVVESILKSLSDEDDDIPF